MRLLIAALLSLALAACATARAEPVVAATWVMRHLDTPAGERDPDLTDAGRRNAELLAGWFGEMRPAAIYITDYKRTRQTVGPLAARLGMTPILYDPADTAGLIARVRATPGRVLIVGHSNTVPDIVAALGGSRPAPLVHEDFGDIWRVGPDGTTTKARIDGRRPR
jgi:broad specificity phosphatase PhoE